jgi:hypothetical protein
LAHIFQVSRRAVHSWAAGAKPAQHNLDRIAEFAAAIRERFPDAKPLAVRTILLREHNIADARAGTTVKFSDLPFGEVDISPVENALSSSDLQTPSLAIVRLPG